MTRTRRLSRAIETAWLALQELDALWVPIIKSWRLNERMYGALTGLSKKAILGEHGADSAWRMNLNFQNRGDGVFMRPRRRDAVDAAVRESTASFRTQVRPGSSSGAAATRRGRRLRLHSVRPTRATTRDMSGI